MDRRQRTPSREVGSLSTVEAARRSGLTEAQVTARVASGYVLAKHFPDDRGIRIPCSELAWLTSGLADPGSTPTTPRSQKRGQK